MSEDSKGKKLFGLIVLAAIAGGGYFVGLPALNWFRLEMAAREAIDDKRLTRFPDAAKVLAVRERLEKEGTRLGFQPLKVDLLLYERRVGPDVWWFVQTTVTAGNKKFATEKRCETPWTEDDLEVLREGGCTVTRLHRE